ncbi:MAG: hypothetical protein JJU13_15095 [Balneolaceae bacterium]|nr:hypothetical protein [Balneolaceae bacterium]
MIRKIKHIHRPCAVLLAAIGMLLWMIHPVVHIADSHTDSHHSSENRGVPDFPEDDCLECVLTTAAQLQADSAQEAGLSATDLSLLIPDYPPARTFAGHGFSLRAPPGLYV